jgi:hypothetical protein
MIEAFLFGGLPSTLLRALSLSKGSPPNKKSLSLRPLRLCVESRDETKEYNLGVLNASSVKLLFLTVYSGKGLY